MSNYGSPRKFRSRYRTCHRQAAARAFTWEQWARERRHPEATRKAITWCLATVSICLLLLSLIYQLASR
ncbi:hypothetical protein [Luteolibacter rhizosphaerae]|uniref:hypothetical protein n=1 Tax=Luteolibacter rhizosphaerae TaxID=2989719 RepID=UPI002223BAFE|nr:hypothetical protein [Luteolibacter rhizosphaerae]